MACFCGFFVNMIALARERITFDAFDHLRGSTHIHAWRLPGWPCFFDSTSSRDFPRRRVGIVIPAESAFCVSGRPKERHSGRDVDHNM